ncbi:flagellar hook-length control protein FliK [Aggregicoccus sp. 17bor-14]|nr:MULTISPECIES: flagellar hook-length control protein FliK [Myxococcaceae]MBF5042480.1 flagellar hook-length control protein FliK [Simulacricoccus sp. 17bor-14]MRI88251.1 flagellar hook-length control protein FliK [Aggregicoccus sp. 17bor-14]
MATDSDSPKTAPEGAAPSSQAAAPELRLIDRRAFVGFPPLPVAPGLVISDFGLQIPDVSFPFNVSAGPTRYQRKRLLFGFLELTVDAALVARKVAELTGRLAGLEELRLHFRPGYLEGQARLQAPERTPITFKVAFDGDGERLAVFLYDVRLYGFSATPAAQVPALVSEAVASLGLLPEVEARGASGFSARVLPALCQLAAVSRGYKLPSLDQARLSAAEVSSAGLRLRFSAGGLPPPATADEEFLLALEGARAFADAEALLASGRLAEAREAYLRAGDAQDAHPFAAERLLSLLVADPQAHDLALDVAAALLHRREKSPAALWGEAVVRERRGERARAAERFLALCALSRRSSEEAAAFFAAEAAARSARDEAPQVAVRALHELLGLRPDHLPSLKALARASDQARDRAGAVRAYRRLAALARDPAEAADAHVHLARLCALTEDDVAGARLHCEAALRLSPDLPDALLLLGELCHRSGEHLRALKALDRLREVGLARHELDRVGQANLLAGRVWEEGLKQPENALLRYREAVSLLPGEPEPLFCAARVAEGLGKLQEALGGYSQALELAGPAPRTEEIRQAAHASHHALARLYRGRLGDPARAREHLEAALALDPKDAAALEELIPYFRASGRADALADALEKAAQVTADPQRRATLWAEAGELARGRLQQPERAERLLASALEADPEHRGALEAMLALAESRRDGPQLTRCLTALARLTPEPQERAQRYRRLAVAARDLTFDLDLAAHALQEVLKSEPEDLPTLGELCALQRKRADMAGLASALEARARLAEAQGDKRLASAALRELAGVLEARLGRVGEALVSLEKAARLAPEPGVLLELADLSLRCERAEHARRALESLLSSLPRSAAPERLAEVRAKLGRACELAGDRDAAIAAYAQAFPLRRLDDALAERLEALYTEAGAAQELSSLWAARAEALSAADRVPEAAPLYLRAARAQLARKDRAGATARLQAALAAHPEGPHAPDALDLLAQLALEAGDKPGAARLLARRAALTPEPRAAARLLMRAASLCAGTAEESSFLADALSREPAFAPARVRRAELRLATDARGALEDYAAVLALPPGDADAPQGGERLSLTRRTAQAAARAGQGEEALRLLADYCAQAPADLEAQGELAELYRRAGAREALAELLAGLLRALPVERRAPVRRELVELALALGRETVAVAALREALAEAPGDVWASRTLLPLLSEASGEAPAARAERLTLLDTLVEAAEGEARVGLLAQRAALHYEAGRRDLSRKDLVQAAALARAPAPFLLARAQLEREEGDAVAELAAWRLALAADAALAPRARERFLALGVLLGLADARVAAREALQAALALPLPLSDEDRCEAQLALAELARRDGDTAARLAALAEAARQGPAERRVEALRECAGLQQAAGALAEAARSLRALLQLSPQDAQARAALRACLEGLEDWEGLAALLEAQREALPAPERFRLHVDLGHLYLERLARPDAAESALSAALALEPAQLPVRRELVALTLRRKAPVEAAGLLEAGAALEGEAREAASLLREGARHARAGGEDALALRLARAAHAQVPAEGEALRELAELLVRQGALAEALPLQRALCEALDLEAAPEAAREALLALGQLAERAKDADAARATYRRLLAAQPDCEPAALRLSALLEREDPRAALEVRVALARALPATPALAERLAALAAEARESLADVGLAASLLARAAELSEAPLPLRRRLADLYRDAGRTPELMAELTRVAQLCLAGQDVVGAADAYEEHALRAEELGRADEALETLTALGALLVERAEPARAAGCERRRAELLRDVKLDLAGAGEALERAHALHPELATVQLGLALALRRDDAAAEARWLERSVALLPVGAAQARALLRLGQLLLGPLADTERAEAALREALRCEPGLAEAERLLTELLEGAGRVAELAAWHEECAALEPSAPKRAERLRRAAALYRERAGAPEAAAVALLAARAATPDDLGLTAEAADLLHAVGRGADAAEFDALLLEQDPFREPSFSRHRAHVEATGDAQALAGLLLRRAEREAPAQACESYLAAAEAFRSAGALERAQLCEAQAFELHPASDAAFERLRARSEGDARRTAEVLQQRARALPRERALPLLRERAERLLGAGEALLAAEAYDAYLVHADADIAALSARAELAAQAGGPTASQPYDRRLLAVAGEALAMPLRVRTHLRLGHASLASGALHDAADAFEAVLTLDAEGQRGEEALNLLAEVHGRTGNTRGLYRASLKLAERAQGPSAEALYRRAADLFDAPSEAIDALLPLARLRPAEPGIIDRAAEGLRALGRYGELLEVYEAGAVAAGGRRAAELLLEAASVAAQELADDARAGALQERAAEADPAHLPALQARVQRLRARGDVPALLAALPQLAALQGDAAGALRLELAQQATAHGSPDVARSALEALVAEGPATAAYAQALELLAPLVQETPARHAELLALQASLREGRARAERLLAAADAFEAAGEAERALESLTLAHAASAEVLPPLALVQRFTGLGAHALACEVGFAAALSAGEPALALQLAERAADPVRERAARWALALQPEAREEAVEALAAALQAEADASGLLELAEGLAPQHAERARGLRTGVLMDDAAPLALREEALSALLAREGLSARLLALLPELEVLSAPLLAAARGLALPERGGVLERAAEAWSAQRAALLRERLRCAYELGALPAAAATLARLAELPEEAPYRAELLRERGELLAGPLAEPAAAREALRAALALDPECLAALALLLPLTHPRDEAAAFVALAEELERQVGPRALAPHRERLADALEGVGRHADAAAQLAQLPESPALLARRAALAERLGHTAEALQLRERLAGDDAAALEGVLRGYLEAQLLPFAVRLAERLLAGGTPDAGLQRFVAERLAPTAEGAALAVRLWRALLAAQPVDADGWTLLGEALGRLGRSAAARAVDGLGAALTSSGQPAPRAQAVPLARAGRFVHPLPAGARSVTVEALPRLHAALQPTLEALGAAEVRLVLDPAGGVEAWLAAPDTLVLGAGALGVFGPVELGFLAALALALGEAGRALATPGEAPALEEAAVAAFRALPATLAACRVLAHLDAGVRGTDPAAVDVGAVLAQSPAFRALALAALDLAQVV